MQRFWTGVVLLALACWLAVPATAEARRYASIVIDARTGQVLHESHADRWVYPASLTKMMTLYMTFEALDQGRLTPGQMLPVSREAASRPPSKLGLRVGQRIAVRDVVSALVTRSANDAAVVIAEALGGTEANFGRMMTERARQIGLRNTTFRNASGLPNEQQRTTARDMATLGIRLQRDFPHHYPVFSTRRFVFEGTVHGNHNRLLASYAGVDGIKTGYIRASGFNLVSSAERNGRRLIGVVIGGQTAASRNAHMVELLDAAFARAARMPATRIAVAPSPRRPSGIAATASAPVRLAPTATASDGTEMAAPIPERRPAAIDDGRETVRLVTAPATRAAADTAPGQISPLRVVIAAEATEQGSSDPVVAAAPPPPATSLAAVGDGADFGVQIGAFDTAVAAHRAADGVLARAADLLRGSAVEVSATDQSGRTLYRARRMGLDRGRAVDACGRLVAQGQACFVVERRGLETRIVPIAG